MLRLDKFYEFSFSILNVINEWLDSLKGINSRILIMNNTLKVKSLASRWCWCIFYSHWADVDVPALLWIIKCWDYKNLKTKLYARSVFDVFTHPNDSSWSSSLQLLLRPCGLEVPSCMTGLRYLFFYIDYKKHITSLW